MIGDWVFTQDDRTVNQSKADSVAVGSYNLDAHMAQRTLAPDGTPKALAYRRSDWASPPAADAATPSWQPQLGTAPTFLHKDAQGACCMNLGAAVFDKITQKVFLHFTVGFKNPSGESVMLVTEDYGVSWHKVTLSRTRFYIRI